MTRARAPLRPLSRQAVRARAAATTGSRWPSSTRAGSATTAAAARTCGCSRCTGSAFTRFARDEYTTLPERVDRPLLIRMDVHWRYGDPRGRTTSIRAAVREEIAATFDDFVRESIQHLVHEMGTRMLARWPQLAEVSFGAENHTRDPAGEAGAGRKLYTDPFPAQGLITPDARAMSGRLTTHVLDTARGRPAAGIPVELARVDGERARAAAHGRHQRRRAHRRAAAGGRRAGRGHLRADLRRRRALRRGLPGRRAGALHGRRRRTRTTTCRCWSRPGPTAPTGAVEHRGVGHRALRRGSAAVSEEPGRLVRRYATPAMREANELVGGWMRDAGLTVREDAAGNLIGRRDGPGQDPAARLAPGHRHRRRPLRRAARRDGGDRGRWSALGPRAARSRVEVIGFADEEGVRYADLLPRLQRGRRAASTPAWLGLEDADGVDDGRRAAGLRRRPRRDRLAAARVRGSCWPTSSSTSSRGRCSSAAGAPVGVVTTITGQTHAEVRFRGEAGHAGTVPMDARRDALAAAAEWMLAVEARRSAAARGWWPPSGSSGSRPAPAT